MSSRFVLRQMSDPVDGVVALQAEAFPPPFSPDLHWKERHLRAHIDKFPEGQLVAVVGERIIGSCSNCIVSEAAWQAHGSWMETVGGPNIENHSHRGTTLYGLDITVHPEFRKLGIGRAFYAARYALVRKMGLRRYGTACRMPDFSSSKFSTVESYAESVVAGITVDRTLTPLLRYGMSFIEVLHGYMDDLESANAAALLEWKP